MKNETRPTPETLEFYLNAKGDSLDKFWDAINKCEELERERDEAREEIARMQTMAASVADIIAKRDAMLEAMAETQRILLSIQLNDLFEDTMRSYACLAIKKLKPFLP